MDEEEEGDDPLTLRFRVRRKSFRLARPLIRLKNVILQNWEDIAAAAVISLVALAVIIALSVSVRILLEVLSHR